MINKYLTGIFKKSKTGEASERSYYPVLEDLLKEFPQDSKNYSVLIESRNSTVGIPDFKIETPKGLLIGYIEAKDIGTDLDRLSKND